MKLKFNILLLGGTEQSKALAKKLVGHSGVNLTSSLAGRTAHSESIPGAVRVGGFGGWQGLKNYLEQNHIDLLIDGTHPFATVISENALKAADALGVRRIIFTRPPWQQQEGDNWTKAKGIEEAVKLISHQTRCFLALGHQHIKPFLSREDVSYVMRMITPPGQDVLTKVQQHKVKIIFSKPGKNMREEKDLFRRHKIGLLVTRNSGGQGAYAKIEAARHLGMPVIMIERPELNKGEVLIKGEVPIKGEIYEDMRSLMRALDLI